MYLFIQFIERLEEKGERRLEEFVSKKFKSYNYQFMRKKKKESVSIKVIKTIIRNYGKGRKLMTNIADKSLE